jgi:hypothetical protein
MYTTDITSFYSHGIGGVMVSVLTLSVVDRGSEPCFGHIKDNKIKICCFTAKHTAAFRRNKNVWLEWYQDSVS